MVIFFWILHVSLNIGNSTGTGNLQLMNFCCCCSSVTKSCLTLCDPLTLWTAACRASLSFTMFWSLLEFMSIELMMPSNHLIHSHPLLYLPSIFPSIRVFSNESALRIRWPKDWSFSFSIRSSNECSGLISFRIDWFNLLSVQGILKSFLHPYNSKALILWRSALSERQSAPTCALNKTLTGMALG